MSLDRSRYWIYGTHAVQHALVNPHRTVHEILYTQTTDLSLFNLKKKATLTDKPSLARLLGSDAVHQGIAASVSPLPSLSLENLEDFSENQLVMILDQVSDPHNVGAILRTCAVFGVKALILTDRHAPNESGVLAKTACGALEHVAMMRVTNLAQALTTLKKKGFWTVGLAESGKKTLSSINWKGKMAIIMGAEGDGMRDLTQKHCDLLAHLETSPEFTTLNVSNAAAIALYEGFKGQRL